MTKLDREKAAVSMAVRTALHKMGEYTIRNSEFFGMNQSNTQEEKQAA